MNTIVTLDLEKAIIEQAEKYAHKSGISLPKLVENYLISISSKGKTKQKSTINPIVESLTGVIPSTDRDNYKQEYQNHLLKKYLQ
jgi:hypothetical protein